MRQDRHYERILKHALQNLGNDPAVETFLGNYGNEKTKALYAEQLDLWFRWLRTKGVDLTPSQVLQDHLTRLFKSEPTDTIRRRHYTSLMADYVNRHLLDLHRSESKRQLSAVAIKKFFQTNDAALFGFFKVAEPPVEQMEAPKKGLPMEDVRKVLATLDLRCRTPLLMILQSGLEIGRVYALEGRVKTDSLGPRKLEFLGRKKHRLPFHTWLGRDSLEAIQALGNTPFPNEDVLRENLHDAARRLAMQGLLKQTNVDAWHPHALRHVFKTEAEHAEIPTGMVEFWLGHAEGIAWVYDHRGEIHPADFEKAYRKLEPVLSMSPDRTVAAEEFEDREREFRSEIDRLEGLYRDLRKEIEASRTIRPSRPATG